MIKRRMLLSLPAVLATTLVTPAAHADNKNFYIVGSIGRTNINTNNTAIDALNLRNSFASSNTTTTSGDTG